MKRLLKHFYILISISFILKLNFVANSQQANTPSKTTTIDWILNKLKKHSTFISYDNKFAFKPFPFGVTYERNFIYSIVNDELLIKYYYVFYNEVKIKNKLYDQYKYSGINIKEWDIDYKMDSTINQIRIPIYKIKNIDYEGKDRYTVINNNKYSPNLKIIVERGGLFKNSKLQNDYYDDNYELPIFHDAEENLISRMNKAFSVLKSQSKTPPQGPREAY
jgi:hypothetical protein